MTTAERLCKLKVNVGCNSTNYNQLLDLRSAQTLNERASSESTAEFLKGLPSYNENNFTRFTPDPSCRSFMRKSAVYLPTKDHPSEQIIVTEKTTILLRYLQQHYEKKRNHLKRDTDSAGPSNGFGNSRKRTRLIDDDY
ncbi:DET1- and DDB1-associated protein 1 [Parasteatoda tepidariorum]|uniref:DET1- and DDB1-associated protein 1 n=1 Tax=Parasteatoda tepidariorum TaxID=114398 RepID=UPI00077FC8FA|nr:DET1- and DDB1-associated protein 1 [Parasteatoda tepidariorum]XP_015906876.1 DET1- and DDB1-associated protein 1 [Parasteatoda tepidariorum]